MKKYYIALCAVCFGMAFTACSNDENEVVKNEGAPLTEIFASAKVASRTAVAEDGVTVTWSSGDAITVIPDNGIKGTPSFKFIQTGEAGQSSSKFFGKADEYDKYVAVYPVQQGMTIEMKDKKLSVSNITIPTEQHAVKGGFDPAANLMAASFTKAEAGEVVFKHMCAFAKITVTQPCKSITFTPNGYEYLAVTGSHFYFQYDEVTGNVTNAHANLIKDFDPSFAKLIPAVGKTEIEVGTYLIAFCPNNWNGNPKFVIENSDGTQLTRTAGAKVTFNNSNLGQVIDFGTASKDNGWTEIAD